MDNMNKNLTVDVVTSVFGNRKIVEECMNTWFPLPANWNLFVYNNKVSDLDGTTQYLLDKQKEFNFVIIDERKILLHPEAINLLIKETTAEWILHLDTDAKLLDRSFYESMTRCITNGTSKVWGRPYPSTQPKFRQRPSGEVHMYVPRPYSWLLAFNKKFIEDAKVDFSLMRIKGNTTASGPKYYESGNAMVSNTNVTIGGDTAWEIYWEACRLGLFGFLPDNTFNCWVHLAELGRTGGGASRIWLRDNQQAIDAMKNETNVVKK